MHFPGAGAAAATIAHNLCQSSTLCDYNLDADMDGEVGPVELLGAFLGTYRATSVFRGRDFTGGSPEIEMLYGNPLLPVYDPTTRTYLNLQPNNLPDPDPLYGFSGFNDFFNLYSWTMAVHNGSLFVGTFDWTYLIGASFFDSDALRAILDPLLASDVAEDITPQQIADLRFPVIVPGADLYRFDDTGSGALPEAVAGLGNIANYGFRTMVADENLWIGTANPMNLLVDEPPVGGLELAGGWEVVQLGDAPLNQYGEVAIPVLGGLWLALLAGLLVFVSVRRLPHH